MGMLSLFDCDVNAKDARAVMDSVSGGWVGPGETCKVFESGLRGLLHAEYAVTTSSGTAAIMALLIAHANAGGNKLLIAPGYGHPAAINAGALLGYQIVLCDVEAKTGCMARARLGELMADVGAAGGVIAYTEHNGYTLETAGMASYVKTATADMPGVGWMFLQDSCQSLQDPHVRLHGDAGVVSFSAQKIITTGQGGAVVTDCTALAEAVRQAITQGVRDRGAMPMRPRSVGVNLRMSSMQAALGLAQLERIETKRVRWAQIRGWYRDVNGTVPWCPYVGVNDAMGLISALASERVHAARLYESADMNLTTAGPKALRLNNELFNSHNLARSLVYLPGHHRVKSVDVHRIRKVVAAYV